MKLPAPPSKYTPITESTRNRILQQSDNQNYKKQQDVVMDQNRLVLRDSAGGYWQILVSPTGVISASQVENLNVPAPTD